MITAESILKEVVSTFEGVRSYSGRFMYGRECVGITTNDISTLQVRIIERCTNLIVEKLQDGHISPLVIAELMTGVTAMIQTSDVRTDNMGLDMIMYFVNWSADEWLADLEEEED